MLTMSSKIVVGTNIISIQKDGEEIQIFTGNDRLIALTILDLIMAGNCEVIRLPPGQG